MTSGYSIPCFPDGTSGAVFACEGVERSVTIMNGPTGCKYYHSAISDDQMLRSCDYDPLNHRGIWYFGQPRVPCTYLDSDDYVFGSKEKLIEALRSIHAKQRPELLCVVNTPGAALIGDDLAAIAKEALPGTNVVTIDSPGYSTGVWNGYDIACKSILQSLPRGLSSSAAADKDAPCVNVLGLSIFHKNQAGDRIELERALNLAGIKVNCFVCCGSTADELSNVGNARLNIVVDAAYGLGTAEYLQERFGTPYLRLPGLPVGFKAVEQMVLKAAELLGTDPAPSIRRSESARARSYKFISRLNSLTGLPKAVPFAVSGTSSEVLGFCSCLIGYYAMAAQSVTVFDGEDSEEYRALVDLLRAHGQEGAFDVALLDTSAQMVFADGNGIGQLKMLGREFTGVEVSLPSLGYTDVVPKTFLGANGGLYLTELVYNGMLF